MDEYIDDGAMCTADYWPEGDTSYAQPVYDNTATRDIASQAIRGGSTSAGQDQWSGFFKNLIGGVAQYQLQKDAMQAGMRPYGAPGSVMPVQQRQNNLMLLLLIGGVVLLVADKG